jgi:hypothetical protein
VSEPAGAIVAAIIAGLVAFFSLVITKEQSVSALRQSWVDSLRTDVAAVVACVYGIYGSSILRSEESGPLWLRHKSELCRFQELVARIRLRLNPAENGAKEGPATHEILATLHELEAIFRSQTPNLSSVEPLLTRLVTSTQVVLKENWERVKHGEPIYRRSMIFAVAGSAMLMFIGFWHMFVK